jgi:hypothetical protein
MYEILKQLRVDMAGVKEGLGENTSALNALRTYVIGQHQDIQNIYAILTRHDARLERIERRSELADTPAQ